jgi:Icc-related predicted phosphoesterase
VKILAISDVAEPMLYGQSFARYASGVEAVVSCGDLPFEYLEYVVTFSGAPLYYVRGNHDPEEGTKAPGGCISIDGRVLDIGGVVLAGLSGSRWYSGGPNQYTERAMSRRARVISARISVNRLLRRGTPDAFVTHAPPLGLGDREDVAHTGFETFLGLMDRFSPPFWLHGHVHLYGTEAREMRETKRGETRVINVFGHRILEVPTRAETGRVRRAPRNGNDE